MSASLAFTLAFSAALVLGLLVKFWLATRQVRHVARHRDQVPAAFAQTISLAAHQKAADYTIAKARFGVLELAWGAAVLLGWTLLGGLDLLNKALLAWMGSGMLQQLALLVAFSLIGGLLDLPFTLWQTFRLEQRFGFNKMTWRLWLKDAAISTGVTFALGLPLAAVVLWLMAQAGAYWWLCAWIALVAWSLFAQYIYPTWIAPLYNKFEPVTDPLLAERVTDLMKRCGFSAKGLFVMDGSRRSGHSNAHFTGLGKNKRVVLFDTLIERLSIDQLEAVLAHELGHFKHRHIAKRAVTVVAFALAAFMLLGWLAGETWFYTGLGVQPSMTGRNDALALSLFMLALPVFGVFIAPLMGQLSRRDEFEADAYAIAQTNRKDLPAALLSLYEGNASTLTPDPVFVKFYYSHPPASERLARMGASPAAA